MKTKIRFTLFVLIAIALAFANISPSLADEETPPADTADIIKVARVLDIYPGIPSSFPGYLAVYGTALFFSANGGNGIGTELWIYDSANPISVSNPIAYDVCPGAFGSQIKSLAVYDGLLYFAADGCDGSGVELWRFDWVFGAQLAADIRTGPSESFPESLTVYKGALYFLANGGDGAGAELWKYDHAVGAQRVADIYPGAIGSYPNDMAVYNDILYFSAMGNIAEGTELWMYDPVNGAALVADINSGSENSTPVSLSVYNGALYFGANGGDGSGKELWMLNEADGVQRVADINLGGDSSYPWYMTSYNGALYFSADGGNGMGEQLWKYEPVNGVQRVTSFCFITPCGTNLEYLVVYGDALYFSGFGDNTSQELWKYNNTAIATFRPSKSYDGWILESGENTNAGGTINATQSTFILGDDRLNKQYRSILSFNTSTLPDNAVIISATLKIRQQGGAGTDPFTTHGNIAVDIIKGAFSGNNALQASDFQSAPGRANAGVIKNLPDLNQWFTSVLKTTSFPFINTAGVTQFRLRFAKDDNDDNGADFLRFFSADTASMSNFPVLEVKYYVP